MSSMLSPNQYLLVNQSIKSPTGRYELIVQPDNNVVFYDLNTYRSIWSSKTYQQNLPVFRLLMQGNGNLSIYFFGGNLAWSLPKGTTLYANSYLLVTDDPAMTVYNGNKLVWQAPLKLSSEDID